MLLASEHAIKSIAFPAISCGVYGFPIRSAADITVSVVAACLRHDAIKERVLLVCFGEDVLGAYTSSLMKYSDAKKSGECRGKCSEIG